MFDLVFDVGRRRPFRVLCVGAHCDDIEIGCGGTLVALQAPRNHISIEWVVMSGANERRKETESAMRMLVRPASRGRLMFGNFPDGRFPAEYLGIKEFFESLRRLADPDLILCHERDDMHQDHRIVNEMIWTTFRDHTVLEYEIPKWDGGLGQPNVYFPIDARQARKKVNALLKCYKTQQHRRDWFTRDTFMAMLRLRGLECRAPSGYAEAYHGRKLQFRS